MTYDEFESLSGIEQHKYIKATRPASVISLASRRGICGFGINDASYTVQPEIDGVRVFCPAYSAWLKLVRRVYSGKEDEYAKAFKICDEWKSLTKFTEWWAENHVDGWELGHELLSDSHIISSETCIFAPPVINRFLTTVAARRGEFMIGVNMHQSGRLRACCHDPITQKHTHLGFFDDELSAHLAWKTKKLEFAKRLKPEMDSIDRRIYKRTIEMIAASK